MKVRAKATLLHGYGIALSIKRLSDDVLTVEESAVVYQASALDPIVLCDVAFTMLLTGLVSVVNPVRRALHIDPAGVLREQ